MSSRRARHVQRRWWQLPSLQTLLLLCGVVYATLLWLWLNRHAGDLLSTSELSTPGVNSRTFRPKLGEIEVVPTPTKPVVGRHKEKHLINPFSPPQGEGVIRARERLKAKVEAEVQAQKQAQEQARKQAQEQVQNQTHSSSSNSNSTTIDTPEEFAARLKAEKQKEVEKHARSVKAFPRGDMKERQLHCIGWRATGECRPNGPRIQDLDFSCSTIVPSNASGYCEVEDTESGERFRVGRRHCDSLNRDAVFRCSDAIGFANFPRESREVADKALEFADFALPNVALTVAEPRDGIVIVVYPKVVASAYATIITLREVLGCMLPIEIWFTPREMDPFPGALDILLDLVGVNVMGEIYFHEVLDPLAVGSRVKVHAIYNSIFERVLYMDADNVPVRDPSFLFQSREFTDTGAMFWPDFWHPSGSIFNIHSRSLLWEMLDLPFANMFEQESGQLLVDRRKHAARLELVRFYAFYEPDYFDRMKLVHGDKDLFRLAWLKLRAPLYMIRHPPAVVGKLINESFCGMTMVQHDARGEVLFLHRNSNRLTGLSRSESGDIRAEAVQRVKEKLKSKDPGGRQTPKFQEIQDELSAMAAISSKMTEKADGYPDPVLWTHLVTFRNTSERFDYIIDTYSAEPEFAKELRCYGQRDIGNNPHFMVQKIADLSFAGLETHLRRYAMEAAQLRQKKSNNS